MLLHIGKDKQFISFVHMKIAQNNVEAVEQYLKENLSSFYSEREIVLFTDILLQDLLAISKSDMLDDELQEEIEATLPEGVEALYISSVAQSGLQVLKDKLWELLNKSNELI